MNLHTCPGCENGKIMVTVHTSGTISKVPLNCTWCLGTGKLDDDRMQDYHDYTNLWCKCGDVGHNVKHYHDGEHPELSKHHYRHITCGKVVQIG